MARFHEIEVTFRVVVEGGDGDVTDALAKLVGTVPAGSLQSSRTALLNPNASGADHHAVPFNSADGRTVLDVLRAETEAREAARRAAKG